MLFECFYTSTLSTLHMLYIVILAIVFKKYGIVDERFEKSLSGLITNLLLPAFIFCEVIQNFDINNINILLQIMLGCFTNYFLGLIFAFIIAKFYSSSRNETNFLMAIFSSPHTTSIPLILIEVLYPILNQIPVRSSMGELVPNAKERGMLYIALNSVFSNVWRWSVSYNLINPEEKNNLTENLVIKENNNIKTKKNILKEILNMPIIVSFLSILLCTNDNVKNAFIKQGSFMQEFFLAVNITIAKCFSFAVIFVLGLNFANLDLFNKSKEDIKWREIKAFGIGKIITITIAKIVIMPLLGVPLIYYFYKNEIIQDGVLAFLYMFMLAAPNAINMIIICSIKKTREELLAFIMVIEYVAAILTLTVANALFLYILVI